MPKNKAPIYVENNIFLGRIEEQKQFRVALSDLLLESEEDESPYILLLYGDGGIGKTSLAKRLRDIVQTEPPFEGEFQILWIDWEEERARYSSLKSSRELISPEAVFDVIHAVGVRNKFGSYFSDYQTMVKQRREVEKKAAQALISNQQKDELVELSNLSAGALAGLIKSGLPVIGTTGEKLVETFLNSGIQVGVEQAARLRLALETRVRAYLKPEQYEIFLNPQEQLAKALSKGLRKLSLTRPLMIVMDTYEIVDRVDVWLRLVVKYAGSQIFWVISGRNDLLRSRRFGSNTSDYLRGYAEDFSQRLLAQNLRQLSLNDVRTYFSYTAPNRSLEEREIEIISQATRGIPLAVRHAAEMWEKGVALTDIIGNINESTPSNQIVQQMTDRYLIHAVAESDLEALYALALANGDIEILTEMLRPEGEISFSLDIVLRRLERDYASVHYDLARLHDENIVFFREYLKDSKRRNSDMVRRLNQKAVDILQKRLQKMSEYIPSSEDRCENDDWAKTAIILTDHLLWLDETKAWEWIIPRFIEGLIYNRDLQRGLLSTVSNWTFILSANGNKRLKNFYISTQPVRSYEEEVELQNELLEIETNGWLKEPNQNEHKAIVRIFAARLLSINNNYENALIAYQEAEQLLIQGQIKSRKLRTILSDSWLITYLQMTQDIRMEMLEETLANYQHIVQIEPQNAFAYHYLGHLYSKVRRSDDAIANFKKAISLAPLDTVNYSCLADCYKELGRYDEAIDSYRKVIDLGDLSDHERGFFHFFRSTFDTNEESHTEPSGSYVGAAYHQIGHILDYQGKLNESIDAFKQAIAVDANDSNHINCLSIIYKRENKLDEGFALLQGGIKEFPLVGILHHQLAHFWEEKGNLEEATVCFRKAIELEPNQISHIACMTGMYKKRGLEKEAEQIAVSAVETNASDADFQQLMGALYSESKKHEESIRYYNRALEIDSNNVNFLLSRAQEYQKIKDYTNSITDLDRAIALDNKNSDLFATRGRVYLSLEDSEKSITDLDTAITLNNKNASFYFARGQAHSALGTREQAILDFDQAIALDNKNGDYLATRGAEYINLRKYERGIVDLDTAITLNNKNASFYFARGQAHSALGTREQAILDFDQAIALDNKNGDYLATRGEVHLRTGNIEKALQDLNSAIIIDDINPSFFAVRGATYFRLNKNLESIQDFDRAISLNPNEENYYIARGEVFSNEKKYEDALQDFSKAISLNPNEENYYIARGEVFSNEKKYEDALQDFSKAIKLNPSDATGYYNLGILLKTLKRYDEAEAAYRKAIELNPSNDGMYIGLINLYRFEQDKSEDALPLLEKRLNLNSENFNAHLAIASINKQLGKEIAAENIEKTRQFIPEDDWYNRACLESVCDNFDLAFEHLEKAAQIERFNSAWAWDDPDLQWITADPRFTKIVGTKPE